MKFWRRRLLAGGLSALLLILAAAVPGLCRDLTPQEQAALFSLADLGAADLPPKNLTVEIYVAPDHELDACRRLLPAAWERVQAFYARMGVLLIREPGQAQPGPLKPAQRLRLEFLTPKQWLDKSCKAFEIAPPFRLRFAAVCRDKCAFAHLPLSTIHISYQRVAESEFAAIPGEPGLGAEGLYRLLIHELGHLLGLYHAHEFSNDGLGEFLPGKVPNFMGHHLTGATAPGFAEQQRKLVHSYLGGGKVFKQYQAVDFDPLRYLEALKTANHFQEPLPRKVSKVAQKVKRGKGKAADEDED